MAIGGGSGVLSLCMRSMLSFDTVLQQQQARRGRLCFSGVAALMSACGGGAAMCSIEGSRINLGESPAQPQLWAGDVIAAYVIYLLGGVVENSISPSILGRKAILA